MKIKICLISYHSSPYVQPGGKNAGGMSIYLKEVCSRLASMTGVAVDIYTRIHDKKTTGVHVLSPSLRVIYLEGGPPELADPDKLFEHVPAFIQRMEDFLETEHLEYDVVYAHYWLSGLVGEWIAMNRDLPLVLTFHTLIYFKPPRPGDPTADRRRMAEDHLIESAAGIVTSSTEERDFLIGNFQLPENKVRHILPGVDGGMFFPATGSNISKAGEGLKANSRPEAFSLLYVGRIVPEKGLRELLEVILELRNTNPHVFARLRLTIVGGSRDVSCSGPEEERQDGGFNWASEERILRAFVNDNKLDKQVVFAGPVKHDDLRSYYTAATACVMPSLSESFGLVMAEALACGIPVLAADIGEMGRFIHKGKNGYLFEPGNMDSLRDGLIELVQKGTTWESNRISKDITSRLSWDKTAERVLKYLAIIKDWYKSNLI